MSMPYILICDDEEDLREMVIDYLEERGYRVEGVPDAEGLRAALRKTSPALIILDVRMPRESGITALAKLRAESCVPVIMLTAASAIVDRVVGLELGADDYIGKPVDLRELEARVKSILRRMESVQVGADSTTTGESQSLIPFGHCTLDMNSARLFREDNDEIPITSMEFALLKTFASNRGRVLSRDQLLELAHDRGWEPFDRSIDLRISRLRNKIEKNPKKPEVIKTVRGIGYRFV
ncbi:response regulator transcription factor [uncultured Roseobacter sp.]|uniref:response regulator n=1 Tax=uncultured Roseobacter sp. TaxID=114847 RepID=UPI00262B3323|nr:response regulator transcription factor [uncultured Roseobacter sp.]